MMVCDAVGHGLPDITAVIDAAVASQFPHSAFLTAAIARLDLDTGRLRWVNAWYPAPLIVRDGHLIYPPPYPPAPPLGLQTAKPPACETQLRPGDRLLLYTDGIVEARSASGEFFGEQRLADFIVRASAAGDPAPETLRRLTRAVLDHQGDHLQDDASIVALEWRTEDSARLTL